MKTTAAIVALCISAVSCSAQNNSDKTTEKGKPNTNVEVNKHYDEFGNLIGYDSSYTWSYKSSSGDSVWVNADSVMNSFREHFNTTFPSFWNNGFLHPPSLDSTFHDNFFRNDYFEKRWREDLFDLEKMFHQMDSVRNNFFEEHYPGLLHDEIEAKPKPKKTKKA